MRRIVVPGELLEIMSPGEVTLGHRESHYARDVLRLKAGDEVTLMDAQGMSGQGHIASLGADGVVVHLQEFGVASAQESPLRVTLVASLPKGAKWDLVIQKTTELGVDRLMPVYTRRSDVRIPRDRLEKRLARWNRIAQEAARQCGRSVAPTIVAPQSLAEALPQLKREDADLMLLAWVSMADHSMEPGASSEHHHSVRSSKGLDDALTSLAARAEHVVIAVGPEGGFEDAEAQACIQHGFKAVGLGPRILRAETAAITLTALVQHRLGDMI